MLAITAADCVPQLCVLCLLQAFPVKVLLLDMLQAFPAKLDLVNSVLADASLPPQERALMEQMKAIAVRQHADYGGRLDYQLLFGLNEPVRWNRYDEFAIGFDEAVKVCLGWCWCWSGAVLCCAVLCCAVLCCAVLCCAVLCCAVLCCAVLCCAVLCCAVLCCPSWHVCSTSAFGML
jgi:hypothetical protein